ncbi:MAG: hypothetical protein JWN86_4172 [Planctomycetota bacterium]|nr:hypothetical protein [Planctomycetota bacterium]
MSLCDRCGLDLDTGQQYAVEEVLDDGPPIEIDPGPPASVIVIGLTTLIASLLLCGLTIFQLEGLGRICLVPVCLFGVLGATQFLQGRSMKPLVVALMIGGAVDILTLIVLPIIQADEMVEVAPPMADGAETVTAPPARPESEDAEQGDGASKPITKHLSDRIDYTKITLGIVVLLLDAAMLIALSAPGVNRHFEHRHKYTNDSGYIIP